MIKLVKFLVGNNFQESLTSISHSGKKKQYEEIQYCILKAAIVSSHGAADYTLSIITNNVNINNALLIPHASRTT